MLELRKRVDGVPKLPGREPGFLLPWNAPVQLHHHGLMVEEAKGGVETPQQQKDWKLVAETSEFLSPN